MAGIILVHHATKKGPDEIRRDPFNCFRGGGALRGHYDAGIIIFRKTDDGDEREVHFELRGGETPDPFDIRLENGRMIKTLQRNFGEQKGWPDRDTCRLILAAIEAAWLAGKPWSTVPQTRRAGRFGPSIMRETWRSISPRVAAEMLEKWLMNGILSIEMRDSDTKLMGLKVVSKDI
jgi:hypothetical protein